MFFCLLILPFDKISFLPEFPLTFECLAKKKKYFNLLLKENRLKIFFLKRNELVLGLNVFKKILFNFM